MKSQFAAMFAQCHYYQDAKKSIATDPIRGNCSSKRHLFGDNQPEISDVPLPKRKRS